MPLRHVAVLPKLRLTPHRLLLSSTKLMATGNTAKWTGIYGRSTPKPDLDPGTIAFKNPPPAATLPANATAEQKVAALKQTFLIAIGNVAANRKIIYGVLVDLKEHFHEYGFKSAAAAVESICQRTKQWANNFLREMEAELEICKVESAVSASSDKEDKKESVALKKVERARDEELEKPHIRTATEILTEQRCKPTENGKPKSQLAIWGKAESIGGAYERAIDDINRLCPNKAFHDRIISTIQDAMCLTRQWMETIK